MCRDLVGDCSGRVDYGATCWCRLYELGMVIVEIVTPVEYVRPVDGFDYCESCNYLTEVWEEYCVDDGSRVVPLCRECAEGMGE